MNWRRRLNRGVHPRERRVLEEAGREPSHPLSLGEYIALVADLPLPTKQQRESFVEYASHAHSWYKHLPPFPPGVPFYFFLDRYAACDRFVLEDGSSFVEERTRRGFHYADLPTREYRRRFGYLAFSTDSGSTVMLVGDGPVATRRDRFAAVCEGGGVLYTLPPEIQQAGKVELTAVIHNHCAAFSFWEDRGDINRHPRRWPEESGGQATLEKIFDRCREMEQPGFKRAKVQIDEAFSASHPELANNLLFADAILHQLFEPERKRQWKEMAVAIDRVCELVSNRRHGPEPE